MSTPFFDLLGNLYSDSSDHDVLNKLSLFSQIQDSAELAFENIRSIDYQQAYRKYLADYRGLQQKTLDDALMFYVLDAPFLEAIMPDEYDREICGLQLHRDRIFRERFVFPIFNQHRHLLAWVGYDYESDTKYLLSFTNIGQKQNIFYNLQNLRSCIDEDFAIVIEGVVDSLRLNELGYLNNLALLGKRMSPYHKRLLNRFSRTLLIPDGDSAGQSALKFWLEGLSRKVFILRLKEEYATTTETIVNEDGEEEVVTRQKLLKDIDDKLRYNPANRVAFRKIVDYIRSLPDIALLSKTSETFTL